MRLYQILEESFKSATTEKVLSHLRNQGFNATLYDGARDKIKIFNVADKAKLIQVLGLLGWYVATDDVTNSRDKSFTVEPRYGVEETNVPRILYHATHKDNMPKIIKMGLVPKTKNKLSHHPDRIYAAKTYEVAEDFSKHFIYGFFSNAVFLEIYTDKINNRWFEDPNMPDGLYTTTNIPLSIRGFEMMFYHR